jgi:BirA family biotin operon repressor/biotin-[acetyl-CoA-carboxylase] ligase
MAQPIARGDADGSPTSGWPFVRTMLEHQVVDSTSERAADLLRQGLDELPLVVWARTQTRGRGRGSHRWWSDAGSLTFTIAIDPTAHDLAVQHEPKLALATAVAVIDALGELEVGGSRIGIRWPNDLEVNGLKLGGILPERLETALGNRLLIGIGLNVRTKLADAPVEVRTMATSLEALQCRQLDADVLPRLLSTILKRFEALLRRLVDGDRELAARWNQLDLLRDKWVRVDRGTNIVAGWGRGIDLDGALCLDDGGQRIRLFGGRVLRSSASEDRASCR